MTDDLAFPDGDGPQGVQAQTAPPVRQSTIDEIVAFARQYGGWVEPTAIPDIVRLCDVGQDSEAGMSFLVEDLIPDGQFALLCGEEGMGKTWLAYQIAGQATAGVPVLGMFDVPRPIRSVLIIDVEQTERDIEIARNEMYRRSVLRPESPVYFAMGALGRHFDDQEDLAWLVEKLGLVRPELLILDTATDAVSKPTDDESVRPLVEALTKAIQDRDVRAVIGLAQPRKRAQGAEGGRSFDDLFGSRLWKSRPSAHFWLGYNRLTVWKQRGSYIGKRFGKQKNARYPFFGLVRSEDGPTEALAPESAEEAEKRKSDLLTENIIKTVRDNPGAYAKGTLATAVKGASREKKLAEIDRLKATGVLGQDPGRFGPNKLVVMPSGEDLQF
jgi:hypothetical protein